MHRERLWTAGLAGLFLLAAGTARADVKLPSVFTDHAVLQYGMPVPIWGWADPGEKVSVAIGKQTASTEADAKGKWQVSLGPLNTGKPVTMIVKGKNQITIKDVLVGEVWLCSGQSNMALRVSGCKDFEKEKAEAKYPQIRMFQVANRPAQTPEEDVPGTWIVCSPETVGGFSATAYFFGREIHKRLDAPVGLINSSVGGTAVEAWTSMDVQKNKKYLASLFADWNRRAANYDAVKAKTRYEKQLAAWKEAAAKARAEGKRPPRRPRAPVDPRSDRNHPSNLFNGMIAPLIPYALRGAIWYQGERNARTVETARLYRQQLPLLIQDWRKRWGQGDFPVYWVQLPNFKERKDDPGETSAWAVIRESMAACLRVPNTGMAVTIDVGEAKNIHPKNKQAVGKRLALAALAQAYKQDVVGKSPSYRSHAVRGNEIVVTFDTGGSKLVSKGDEVRGFALADAKGQWHWAKARIDGDQVIVSHPDVKKPTGVRYAWGDNPDCNLYNAAGLPAGPFRK
jgi:sialate O-acetylesterase